MSFDVFWMLFNTAMEDDYRTISPESVASWVTDNDPTVDPRSQAVPDTELEPEPNSQQTRDTSDDFADEEFEGATLQERMRAYSRILGVPMPYMNHVQEQQRVPSQDDDDDQGECDEREDSSCSSVVVQPLPLPLPISRRESDDSDSSSFRTFSENDNADASMPESQEVDDELELAIPDDEEELPDLAITEIPTTPSLGDRPSSDSDSEITFESLPSLTACKRRRLRESISQ